MYRCIYCNSENLTVSDIIPYALTGAKIKRNFVCKEHNAFTNDHFEKHVISEYDFFRNTLGLTTRDGKPIKYTANLEIDDLVVSNTLVSNRASIYSTDKRLFQAEKDGKKVLIGSIEKLKKINGSTPESIDMKNLRVNHSFSLDKLFTSDMVLHTVAKIAYEWHCFVNNVCCFDNEKYQDIVGYILEQQQNDYIVEIVVDGNVIKAMEQLCDLGTNSLYEYIDVDGCLYVIFNFWNIAIYKVKIIDTKSPNKNPTTMFNLHRYRIDGIKDTTVFGVYGAAHVISEPPAQALHRMKNFYINKLEALTKTKILSIYLVKQMVEGVRKDLEAYKKGKIDFTRFMDYEENDRVTAIRLILCFAENKDSYNTAISFIENLRTLFKIDKELIIQKEEKIRYLTKLVQLNETGGLIPMLDDGITMFDEIWENEIIREKP